MINDKNTRIGALMMNKTEQALEVLENSLSFNKLKENELEVKNSLKQLIVNAEEGDQDAQDVLFFINNIIKRRKTA